MKMPTFTQGSATRVWYTTILFWALALLLSAGGHRLFIALRTLDQHVSSSVYQQAGQSANWVGHATAEQSLERYLQSDPRFVEAIQSNTIADLCTLPVSPFWAGLGGLLTIAAAVAVWAGRWIPNNGLQSLVGALAGHAIWIGAVEVGLDTAGRKLGLAGALSVVENRIVGVHGAGVLIQWSALFLVPVMIGLTLHESNRCVIFRWLRERLPLTRSVAASGRVENYAARTLIQFFMTVWVCYAAVLWMADQSVSPWPHATLLISLLAIALGTPYMIYRTTRQRSAAAMFRYSVSGAVLSWSGIEIASATGMFSEPWLSTSVQSLLFYTVAPMILLSLAIVALRHTDRSAQPGDDAQEELSSRSQPIRQRALVTSVLLLSVGASIAGCRQSDTPQESLTPQQIIERLEQIEARVRAVPADAMGGIMHALASPDRESRLSAIASCGKSKHVSSQLKNVLLELAETDPDPLVRGAALRALYRLGRPSAGLKRLVTQLQDDPVLGDLAGGLK